MKLMRQRCRRRYNTVHSCKGRLGCGALGTVVEARGLRLMHYLQGEVESMRNSVRLENAYVISGYQLSSSLQQPPNRRQQSFTQATK